MFENVANLSWQKGKHAFKFGVDIRQRLISETATPPGESAFGRFSFSAGFTNNPSNTGGSGDAIASMLLGYPTSTVRDFFIPGIFQTGPALSVRHRLARCWRAPATGSARPHP